MQDKRAFSALELEWLRKWARSPRDPVYARLEARKLSDEQVRFMQEQIRVLSRKGTWRCDPRPTELSDLLADLAG